MASGLCVGIAVLLIVVYFSSRPLDVFAQHMALRKFDRDGWIKSDILFDGEEKIGEFEWSQSLRPKASRQHLVRAEIGSSKFELQEDQTFEFQSWVWSFPIELPTGSLSFYSFSWGWYLSCLGFCLLAYGTIDDSAWGQS